jgi:hypothetical protein
MGRNREAVRSCTDDGCFDHVFRETKAPLVPRIRGFALPDALTDGPCRDFGPDKGVSLHAQSLHEMRSCSTDSRVPMSVQMNCQTRHIWFKNLKTRSRSNRYVETVKSCSPELRRTPTPKRPLRGRTA